MALAKIMQLRPSVIQKWIDGKIPSVAERVFLGHYFKCEPSCFAPINSVCLKKQGNLYVGKTHGYKIVYTSGLISVDDLAFTGTRAHREMENYLTRKLYQITRIFIGLCNQPS